MFKFPLNVYKSKISKAIYINLILLLSSQIDIYFILEGAGFFYIFLFFVIFLQIYCNFLKTLAHQEH